MTTEKAKDFRKKSKLGRSKKYPEATKRMLPKPKPKPMTIKEIERELKLKKQRRRGPRVRGKKAIT